MVLGYLLGISLGMGVVGVWLGMFMDWAVRGACFWWRLVSGHWLNNYRRLQEKSARRAVMIRKVPDEK